MGCGKSKVKENFEFNFKQSDKEIEFRADICGAWGFDGKASSVKELMTNISNSGFKVKFELNPIPGRTGVYKIVQILQGKENCIFSNNSKDSSAIINKKLSSDLFENIKSKIQ